MAQVVKLKRTAVAGKVPSVSNLELGELAINTFDGRIFFEKDNGVPSIQHVVTTNSSTTGALDIHGDISASNLYVQGNTTIDGNLTLGGNITIGDSSTDTVSITADLSSSIIPDLGSTFDLGSSTKKWNNLYAVTASADKFIGDGSGLTNITTDVGEIATITSSFDSVSSFTVNHNFDTRNIIVSIYDTNYSQLIPQSITLTDSNNVDVVLSAAHSGFAVVAKGGHIVSGTLAQEVSEVSTVTASFDNQTSVSVVHNFDSKNLVISVYDNNDTQLIPQSVVLTNSNTADITLSGAHSGFVVVAKGGHFVTGSAITSYTNLTNIPNGIVSGSSQLTSSLDLRYALSGSVGGGGTSDFTELINVPSGLVSGSSQLTSSYDTRYVLTDSNNTFSGETTFTNKITHTNGFIVLSEVSQSLNFVDDTAAAAGGVPLGGLYRNGNFIAIRIT